MDIILSVIDTSNNTVIDTINFGNCPKDIVYNPDNHDMYITNHDSNIVTVISTAFIANAGSN